MIPEHCSEGVLRHLDYYQLLPGEGIITQEKLQTEILPGLSDKAFAFFFENQTELSRDALAEFFSWAYVYFVEMTRRQGVAHLNNVACHLVKQTRLLTETIAGLAAVPLLDFMGVGEENKAYGSMRPMQGGVLRFQTLHEDDVIRYTDVLMYSDGNHVYPVFPSAPTTTSSSDPIVSLRSLEYAVLSRQYQEYVHSLKTVDPHKESNGMYYVPGSEGIWQEQSVQPADVTRYAWTTLLPLG